MLKQRQERYDTMRQAGFMDFEAKALSAIPKKVPYMKPLISKRFAEYTKFSNSVNNLGKDKKDIDKAFENRIIKRYKLRKWAKKGEVETEASAWNMLRSTDEKKYKKDHPAYDKDRDRYPKKSHHRSGEETMRKLRGSMLDDMKQELAQLGNADIPRVAYLKAAIKDIEGK